MSKTDSPTMKWRFDQRSFVIGILLEGIFGGIFGDYMRGFMDGLLK